MMKPKVRIYMVVTTATMARFHVRIEDEKGSLTEFTYEVEGDFRGADHAELIEIYGPAIRKLAKKILEKYRKRKRIQYPVELGEIED